ncbi:MAG: response regulator transcription factor [Thermomicrobiales bacterium]
MIRNNRGPISLWQIALYIAVLGVVSMLLAPLTALWWIVPLLGAATPVSLAAIQARERREARAGNALGATPAATPATAGGPARPEPAARRALDTGGAPDLDQEPPAARPAAPDTGLSEREQEVLALLATGQTNAEVADALFISVGTVKSHSANIYRKLEVKNRTEAVSRARELGLLP